jgi:HSP20 family protein
MEGRDRDMADTESKALQAKEKREVSSAVEQTRPGLVFTPAVDILETEKELTLLADMPGVNGNALTIDLKENVLTLTGEVDAPEGANETDVFREYRVGRFFREFSLSNVIDQTKIEAELKDGVLRLRMPKVAAATPRKIAVKAG